MPPTPVPDRTSARAPLPRATLLFRLAWIAVVAAGVTAAARVAWVTDDAYISFRYADHLARGQGLVYNAGERVEGYSNFLWTLWCAAGSWLGADLEAWAIVSGLACYGLTLLLLSRFSLARSRATGLPPLPVAAALGALHTDWHVFATSGLETSLFTLLVAAGFVALTGGPLTPRRAAGAGAIYALAALTRPDGVLLALPAVVWLLATAPRARALAFAAPLAAVLGPYALWKLSYYGDLLPNTYYAKSAHRPWWDQGLAYAGFYFRKYWALPAGALLWLLARPRSGGDPGPEADGRRAAWLAGSTAVLYTLYVIHVGGDFMYARLLIPVAPLWLVLAELGCERLAARGYRARAAAAAALAAGLALTPHPLPGEQFVRGIVNEWAFYSADERTRARAFGLELRRLFDGLPMRVAFCGGQAVHAWHSRAPLAIETATGLTDSLIAHGPLGARGRPGHEKRTPPLYLIEQRRAHFWMYASPLLSDTLAQYIPLVRARLDTLPVMVLSWDPPVMDALRRRGAVIEDFPAALDQLLPALPYASDAEVADLYAKCRRFYFGHVSDPGRERPFLERLARAGPGAGR